MAPRGQTRSLGAGGSGSPDPAMEGVERTVKADSFRSSLP